MEEAEQRVVANDYVLEGSFDSWWSAFRDANGGAVPQVRPLSL